MSIIHVPFYPSDWLAGTRGLSASETGVYITLIARMYEMAGPIDRDDDRLHRLCGTKTKPSFKKALDYLISEGKIIELDGSLFNERVEKEIKNVTEKSSKAREAAESRWSRKSNKNNDNMNAVASPKHMPQPCQSKSKSNKRDTNVSPKKGSRLPDIWVLPKDWGEWATAEGYAETVVRSEAEKFKDYWIAVPGQKGVKLDWSATWRNWMRRNGAKVINGGHHGKPTNNTDRVQRVVTAAAAGTSAKDWG